MNLRDAVRRNISYKDPKSSKTYQLKSKVKLKTPALVVCERLPSPSLWGSAWSAPWCLLVHLRCGLHSCRLPVTFIRNIT